MIEVIKPRWGFNEPRIFGETDGVGFCGSADVEFYLNDFLVDSLISR
jgi:hypothetical protein